MMKALKLKRTVAIITITLTLIALVMAMTSLAFNFGPPEGRVSFTYGGCMCGHAEMYGEVNFLELTLEEILGGGRGDWTILAA